MSGKITLVDGSTEDAPTTPLTPETPDDNDSDDNDSGDNGGDVPTTNGGLTITGIPEKYNGKYIYTTGAFAVNNPTEGLYAMESIQWSERKATLAKISNGSATLNVYKFRSKDITFEDMTLEDYSGNETVGMRMYVWAFPSINIGHWDGENNIQVALSSTDVKVTFTNGKGTVSVAGATFEDEY
jgi:hypothetical protein